MATTQMNQTIKIHFTDFWKGFDIQQNIFVELLSKQYNVVFDKHPDYLFYSAFGYDHLNYKDCVKIYYTGENNVPDFNLCDYAIGFHYIDFEDRYHRFPVYLLDKGFRLLSEEKTIDASSACNRKFCNFVYSNNKLSDPARELFFHQLSRYKKVDSGGRYLNNIGQPVADKIKFIREYKFTIAFENSCVSGYTTEKMTDPMLAGSIPIYWGNPKVGRDFNKDSIICVNDFETIEKAIDEIIRLDNDDSAYLEKLSQPWLTIENDYDVRMAEMERFLSHIINQPKENSKQMTPYGFVQRYTSRQKKMAKILSFIHNMKN